MADRAIIVVSPYAKAGYVSHVNYEFGSILKLIEQTFNFQRNTRQITSSDSRSTTAASTTISSAR